MADQLVASAFDYGDLDAESVDALERHAEAIAEEQSQVRRRAAQGVICMGRELAAAHDLLAGKGRDGLFRPWVQERCEFSYRTAYNAIQASETFGTKKCETVSHFFDVAAMYLLSSDSCPLGATEAAIRLAKKGRHITKRVAEELRNRYVEPETEQLEETDDAAETGEEPGDEDARHAGQEAADEPYEQRAQEEPEADMDERAPEDDISQEMPLPSPVSASPSSSTTPPGPQAAESVLGKLRSAVMSLAARTSDKANLVRSIRTLALPEVIHAVAGALQGHTPPAVGNFLTMLAEEIEEDS